MPLSRLSRLSERKEKRRLLLAIAGIIAVVAIVALFGIKALIGFSVLMDQLHGAAPTPTQNQSIILPPTLDPPPESTNTATISVSGKGQANDTLIVYLNDREFNKLSVLTDGSFSINNIPLDTGLNSISAKITDDKGTTSDLSNIVSVTYVNKPPKLDVNAPSDNANITGDPSTVTVTGSTDDNVSVNINDRQVVVRSDNTFSYDYPLNDGDNILNIIATDTAGNQTKVTRKIIYHH